MGMRRYAPGCRPSRPGGVTSVWTDRPRRRDPPHILASPGRRLPGPAGSTLRQLTEALGGQLFRSGFCVVLPVGAVRSMAL